MKATCLLLLLLLFSCKDSSNAEASIKPETFNVYVNLISKADDDFCLLYTQDNSINFSDGVWVAVKGNDAEQIVNFSLPKDVLPSQLRLDFGKNRKQSEVVIKSIKFEYLGKSREIKGFEMGAFFRPDNSKCSFDSNTGVVKAIIKDGVNQGLSLYPHESILAAELPKLYK